MVLKSKYLTFVPISLTTSLHVAWQPAFLAHAAVFQSRDNNNRRIPLTIYPFMKHGDEEWKKYFDLWPTTMTYRGKHDSGMTAMT